MARMTKWATALCIGSALVIASCGNSTAPTVASPNFGWLSGEADQCSGLPGGPAHPVQVIVYRGKQVALRQTQLGSHRFRFPLSPGRYRVTTNQSYAVPVTVTVHSGQVAHASISAACD
jgi:hypothetical protein